MGKRKSTRAKSAPKKKVEKLETLFCCPFCNHAGSVECTIDLKNCIAEAACFVCKESYSTKAHALTEPIDVYGEWIDECEKANEGVEQAPRDSYYDDDGEYA
ncbi:transcription elongation factor 1 homolog [Lolium rigidum]|jgi:transcription elongation factor Elf1|uniref:transcription elongation factor 1 homolog n=1 Tax=Lolium rigidum TaxID=89674 RepID=UPI001F5CB144|nr:transcription elongation factor 1 homolog [Lolium rigidum]XP_051200093.1 transcription elongation factor 1 homolog [Lolium perenne]